MEYVYAAMLLHKAKKEVNEANIEAILKSAGVEFDSARVKAMVASIKNINIDEAIEKAALAPATTAPVASAEAKEEEPEEEDTAKKEEEAAAGLGALFG